MKRIGIMGGTFDPIHLGHLELGKQAYQEYHMDEIWYMPSRQPPHKKDHVITDESHRYHMIQLAVAPFPFMKASDFELRRTGRDTYTVETLRLLKERYPDVDFYFIMGADSLLDIEGWYQPEAIMALTKILVADRQLDCPSDKLTEKIGYLSQTYGADIRLLHSRLITISSEEIRTQPEAYRSFLPGCVWDYMEKHKLYGVSEQVED